MAGAELEAGSAAPGAQSLALPSAPPMSQQVRGLRVGWCAFVKRTR